MVLHFSIHGAYYGAVAWFTLRGIGEVQSPPGRTYESKTGNGQFQVGGAGTTGGFENRRTYDVLWAT